MSIIRAVGVSAVATYLGTSTATVYSWLYRHGPGSESSNPIPEPVCCIAQGRNKKNGEENVAYGWRPTQLAEFREWYSRLKGWDMREAAHHWVEVDAKLKESEGDG